MKKNWLNFAFAYIMWAVFIGLGLIYLVISRTALTAYLHLYYIQENFQRGKQAELIEQAYFLIAGVILVILMIVVEEYFKNGARKNVLLRRLARVFGMVILLICLANVAMAIMIGFSTLVMAVLLLEFFLGCLFLWFGFRISPILTKT